LEFVVYGDFYGDVSCGCGEKSKGRTQMITERPETFKNYSHAFGRIDHDTWLVEFRAKRAPVKTVVKLIYKFVLFDPKTGSFTRIGEMPERRRDPKRMGKETVLNWLKVTYGKEWFEKNKNLVGIIKVKV
jgi:hypothetical protein